METYQAAGAMREFGEVLHKSQSGLVGVTQNGKAVTIVLSEV